MKMHGTTHIKKKDMFSSQPEDQTCMFLCTVHTYLQPYQHQHHNLDNHSITFLKTVIVTLTAMKSQIAQEDVRVHFNS
jgi:hypothetical protein